MTKESAVRTSKYIKTAREEKIFEKTVVFFLFSLFVMPQYFGLPTPLFDFTLLRMMLILVLFMIIYDDERNVAYAACQTNAGAAAIYVRTALHHVTDGLYLCFSESVS